MKHHIEIRELLPLHLTSTNNSGHMNVDKRNFSGNTFVEQGELYMTRHTEIRGNLTTPFSNIHQ